MLQWVQAMSCSLMALLHPGITAHIKTFHSNQASVLIFWQQHALPMARSAHAKLWQRQAYPMLSSDNSKLCWQKNLHSQAQPQTEAQPTISKLLTPNSANAKLCQCRALPMPISANAKLHQPQAPPTASSANHPSSANVFQTSIPHDLTQYLPSKLFHDYPCSQSRY